MLKVLKLSRRMADWISGLERGASQSNSVALLSAETTEEDVLPMKGLAGATG